MQLRYAWYIHDGSLAETQVSVTGQLALGQEQQHCINCIGQAVVCSKLGAGWIQAVTNLPLV